MRLVESTRAAMFFLFIAALVDRLALAQLYAFDGLYGQDAYAYFAYAREGFQAWTHWQTPPAFWWPLGYPALLNAAFLVGGANIATAQIATMLCGALVAPFAFALAREAAPHAYKHVAGWVAGLLCAVNGQLAQSSVVIMADAPALMWAALGAWLLLRYARTRNVWTLAIASFAVGMAVWTRWQNLIFAAVWILTLLLMARQENVRVKHGARGLLACGIIAIVLLPQLLIRTTTNAPLAGQSWLEGWSALNFFARSFDNADGHFDYALPVAIFYGQVFAHPAYLFGILTPLFVVGVWRMNSPQQHRQVVLRRLELFPKTILLLGWILGMYFFLAGIPYENFRFSLGLFAPIAVVTGIGGGWVWEKWRARERLKSLLLLGWIGVALLVMLVWQPRVLAPVLDSKARELAHVRWLETQLLPNALVYTMSIDGALKTYSKIRVENLWNMDPATLPSDVPTYLYADTNNIDSQWRGRLPDQLVRGLTETNFLHPLDTFEGWTLYRVRDCTYRVLDCE